MKVSIIIPAFNEAASIGDVVQSIKTKYRVPSASLRDLIFL